MMDKYKKDNTETSVHRISNCVQKTLVFGLHAS